MFFFLVSFFILSFIRWERGTDWMSYLDFFEDIEAIYPYSYFEFLFTQLNLWSHRISNNYTFCLFLQAVLIYSLSYISIKKYSLLPVFSVLIWFSFSFAGIFFVRQTIAVALILFSFFYIVERRFWYFFALVIIATLFHKSAIVFLPAYYLFTLNLSKKQIFIMIAGSFLLSAITGNFFTFLATYNIDGVSDKAESYMEVGVSDSFGSSFSPLETMLRGVFYRIFIIIFVLNFLIADYKKDYLFRGLINLYLVGVMFFIIFVPISVTLIRFSSYYEILQIFIYPYIVLKYKNDQFKNLALLLLLAYFAFRFYGVVQGYEKSYIPFKTIFNKELPVEI